MASEICFVVTDAISLNVLYRGQLEYLQRMGAKLTLICGGEQSEVQRLRDRQVGQVIDFGFVRRPSCWRDAVGLVRLVWYFLWHRYDVVLSTTPKAILLGSIAGWVARQRHRVVFFQGRVYENAGGLRRRLFAGLDRLAIRMSTRALFVSRSLLAAYSAEGLLPKGANGLVGEVLGPGSVGGVDMDRFSPGCCNDVQRAALKHSLAIEEGDFVAITVGRIGRDKGLAELAELARMMLGKSIVFLMVGSIETREEADAANLLGLPNVRYVPFTDQVAQLFAIADIHLFLTHREGFGNVAVEAAACDLPTLAFDVVGVRDSVAEGVSGLRVPFGALVAIGQTLELAMCDPIGFRARFAGARAWADTTYASERVWQRYADFLVSLR